MNQRRSGASFASRPADPDQWVRTEDTRTHRPPSPGYSARLTIDVTPTLRGRIKIVAFARGITVAEMLRTLLEREFPDTAGDPS
jgi:hypothetical protein